MVAERTEIISLRAVINEHHEPYTGDVLCPNPECGRTMPAQTLKHLRHYEPCLPVYRCRVCGHEFSVGDLSELAPPEQN